MVASSLSHGPKDIYATKDVHLLLSYPKLIGADCPTGKCSCTWDPRSPDAELYLSINRGLLRTCRQIYSESIKYLYKCNTFCISPPNTTLSFFRLHDITPPKYLHQVQSLRLVLDISQELNRLTTPEKNITHSTCTDDWYALWTLLNSLKSLRDLRIELKHLGIQRLSSYDVSNWCQHNTVILEPVKSVVGVARFVVVLPIDYGAELLEPGESKCEFTWPGRE